MEYTDKAFRRLERIVSDGKRGTDMKSTDGTSGGFATLAARRERGLLGLGRCNSPRIACPAGIVNSVYLEARLAYLPFAPQRVARTLARMSELVET